MPEVSGAIQLASNAMAAYDLLSEQVRTYSWAATGTLPETIREINSLDYDYYDSVSDTSEYPEDIATWERDLLSSNVVVSTVNLAMCQYCGVNRPPENLTTDEQGRIYCESCHFECMSCHESRSMFDRAHRSGRDWCCYRCGGYCPVCSEFVIWRDPEFHRCGDVEESPPCDCGDAYCVDRTNPRSRPGMATYHHTQPFLWLGGENQPYYVGFELEISARNGVPVYPIYEWAHKNLGSQYVFDCKFDSSVRGFEIASQPMTPAYFESVDWDSFFVMLNREFPIGTGRFRTGSEPDSHGLHVHVGRTGIGNGKAVAAYSYLLHRDNHLTRIARREPTSYCVKSDKPISEAVLADSQSHSWGRHKRRLQGQGVVIGRGAVNLQPRATVEIRAFRSTRRAKELRDAVRVSYLAADYIKSISTKNSIHKKSLDWNSFARWVATQKPEAFASIVGLDSF